MTGQANFEILVPKCPKKHLCRYTTKTHVSMATWLMTARKGTQSHSPSNSGIDAVWHKPSHGHHDGQPRASLYTNLTVLTKDAKHKRTHSLSLFICNSGLGVSRLVLGGRQSRAWEWMWGRLFSWKCWPRDTGVLTLWTPCELCVFCVCSGCSQSKIHCAFLY